MFSKCLKAFTSCHQPFAIHLMNSIKTFLGYCESKHKFNSLSQLAALSLSRSLSFELEVFHHTTCEIWPTQIPRGKSQIFYPKHLVLTAKSYEIYIISIMLSIRFFTIRNICDLQSIPDVCASAGGYIVLLQEWLKKYVNSTQSRDQYIRMK